MTGEATPAPIPDSYQVDLAVIDISLPNQAQFWGGAYPGNRDQKLARARLEQFLDASFNIFINLTEAQERSDHYDKLLTEAAIVRNTAVTHQRIPIQDFSTPAPATLRYILDTIDASLAMGNRVYVHCWGGIGRTGTVIGCWLVRHGLSGQQALEQIASWRRSIPSGSIESPETAEQRAMVLNWHANET